MERSAQCREDRGMGAATSAPPRGRPHRRAGVARSYQERVGGGGWRNLQAGLDDVERDGNEVGDGRTEAAGRKELRVLFKIHAHLPHCNLRLGHGPHEFVLSKVQIREGAEAVLH